MIVSAIKQCQSLTYTSMVIFKVLVVQTMDKAIFWINLYPMQLGSLIYKYMPDSDFFQ